MLKLKKIFLTCVALAMGLSIIGFAGCTAERLAERPVISPPSAVFDRDIPADVVFDVTLTNDVFVSVTGNNIASGDFTFAGSTLTVRGSFLLGLRVGYHTFVLNTENFTENFTISVIGPPPTITAFSVFDRVYPRNVTKTLAIGTADSFISVTGNGITTDNYTLTGNMLTIDKNFLRALADGEYNFTLTTADFTEIFTIDVVDRIQAHPIAPENRFQWNSAPVVLEDEIFYDDFRRGINPNRWVTNEGGWGTNNNGYRGRNVFHSHNRDALADWNLIDPNSGMVIFQSNGDLMTQPHTPGQAVHGPGSRQREGAALITRDAFGPGLYEVRMKLIPKPGTTNAIWNFWDIRHDPRYQWGNMIQGLSLPEQLAIQRYTEIDIEFPSQGDYRRWEATIYCGFIDTNNRRMTKKYVNNVYGLNNGEWHDFAFEWRNNPETGDVGVVYYVNGQMVDMFTNDQFMGIIHNVIETNVPYHTATFWLGTLFPNAVGWLGDPRFETLYMYIDWVRITPFDDYVRPGSNGSRGGQWADQHCTATGGTYVDGVRVRRVGTDLGDAPIPRNNFIANGGFTHDVHRPSMNPSKPAGVFSWNLTGGTVRDLLNQRLNVAPNGRATQEIQGQYAGYRFNLNIDAEVVSGVGDLTVRVEFLSGMVNTVSPIYGHVGWSPSLTFNLEDGRTTKTLPFTVGMLGSGADLTPEQLFSIQTVRVTIETATGTTARVYNVEMFMVCGNVRCHSTMERFAGCRCSA